jgi:acyl-coenzyme A thioesterase PaaI-like protein
MTVNYLSVAPGEDIVAEGVCTRRGRSMNFAQVVVTSQSGKRLVEGMLTVNIAGRRTSAP